MSHKPGRLRSAARAVPSLYIAGALATGFVLPRLESRLWPQLTSGVNAASATPIYSSIAAGMMGLTAIVFSLTFVMVHVGANAYSRRLVLWLSRDPLIAHALGVFSATLVYATAALAWVDRGGAGEIPLVSAAVIVVLLAGSIAMFVGLIQRTAMLRLPGTLTFIGDEGRRVIATLYSRPHDAESDRGPESIALAVPTQLLTHLGRPRAVQRVDVAALAHLARGADATIEVLVGVGDTVMESTPLLRVLDGKQVIDDRLLAAAIEIGPERTFEQDPKYALRLLVDIAISALSPAGNDPATAVQALDQIGDLLLHLGRRCLDISASRDERGMVRVIVPWPTWEDFLRLAFEEILRSYGATSVQATRRMRALVADLMATVPDRRRAALACWQTRLDERLGVSPRPVAAGDEVQSPASVLRRSSGPHAAIR